jgi:L-alanine-DL-glutamate epimerase-like enolase superfamily enzyme
MCGLKRCSPRVSGALDIAITRVEVRDVRFPPTSRTLAGSDAMNEAPDYSAAYVILETEAGLAGHGMTFTIGRGTEIVVTAIHALEHLVVGRGSPTSPRIPAGSGGR